MEPDQKLGPEAYVHLATKSKRYPCGELKGAHPTWARTTDPEHVTCEGCGGAGPPLPEYRGPHRLQNGNVVGPAGMGFRRFIAERDGGSRCAYCKREYRLDEMVLEHVVPKSKGGVDTAENRVLSCEDCDSDKKDRTPQEWRPGVVWGHPILDSPSPKRRPPPSAFSARPEDIAFCATCQTMVYVPRHKRAAPRHVILESPDAEPGG